MGMKILNQPIGSMYLWSIILLVFLAGVSSYMLRVFPTALILAVIACVAFEMMINRFYHKRSFKIPLSGIITGLIIGSVAPYNAPLLAILVASAVAILSKFFIRIKSVNVFNPASLGLLVGLATFSLGDAWWTASNISIAGTPVSLAPILIVAAYEARRLPASLSFIAVVVAVNLFAGYSGGTAPSLTSFEAALIGVNYFFALLMLPEPKTSPHKNQHQVVYGISAAVIFSIISILGIHYSFFIALLLCNLAYALYRRSGHRIHLAGGEI